MNTILKRLLVTALVFPNVILAQDTIKTYAGNDALVAGSGQLATAAQFAGPKNIVVDGQGNVYFSASGRSMDLKVATNGCTSRTPATT